MIYIYYYLFVILKDVLYGDEVVVPEVVSTGGIGVVSIGVDEVDGGSVVGVAVSTGVVIVPSVEVDEGVISVVVAEIVLVEVSVGGVIEVVEVLSDEVALLIGTSIIGAVSVVVFVVVAGSVGKDGSFTGVVF